MAVPPDKPDPQEPADGPPRPAPDDQAGQPEQPSEQPSEQPGEGQPPQPRPDQPTQPEPPHEHRYGESAGETEGYELAHPETPGNGDAAPGKSRDPRAAASARTAARLDATTPAQHRRGAQAPKTTQTAPRPQKKRDLTAPPRRREALTGWLTLLACLAIAALPLSVDLRRPAVTDPAEAQSLQIALETWDHLTELTYDEWSLEPLVPIADGQPQLDATPGTTWLHLLAFKALPDAPSDTVAMIFAGRLASLAMALLTVGAVFWAGMSIGGLRTATLAALVCTANPVFLYYGRLASPVIVEAAIAVLCVASAVWAVRPLKLPGGVVRQALGWLICGVCLGAAVLTGGLRDLPFILLPILLIFALYPHRLSHLMGLVAAVIIAVLLTTPWALYVHERDAAVWQSWAIELVPAYFYDLNALGRVVGERLGLLVLATLPWTPWLVAGLLQPFSTSSAGARLRMLLGWVWFVPVGLLLLGAPGHGAVKEMLIVLPAAALLSGQVLRQFSDLSDEGRHARIWRLTRWPFCFVLMFASVAIPGFAYLSQAGMLRVQWLPATLTADMPPWYWLGLGGLLLLTVLLSMRFCERNHPGRAAACWACWMIAAFTVVAIPVARGPLVQTPTARAGYELRQVNAGAPIYWLDPAHDARAVQADAPATSAGMRVTPGAIDPRLELYARRPMHAISPRQLSQLRAEQPDMLVLTTLGRSPGENFAPKRQLEAVGLTLWRAQSAAPPATQPSD